MLPAFDFAHVRTRYSSLKCKVVLSDALRDASGTHGPSES